MSLRSLLTAFAFAQTGTAFLAENLIKTWLIIAGSATKKTKVTMAKSIHSSYHKPGYSLTLNNAIIAIQILGLISFFISRGL